MFCNGMSSGNIEGGGGGGEQEKRE